MLKNLLTPRRVIFVGGLIALLLAVAWSWRTDEHLHVYVLDVDGHPVLVQTPSGKQILIGGSNSPSSLLSALGNFLPFWDRNLEVVIVPQASGDQLNGLSAVLDRYDVQQLMSVEVSPDNRAGRDWQAMLTQKGKKPIELQNAELDAGVSLTFDGAVPLIEAQGCAIALGASERAQIAVIAGKLDRLPTQPQLILTWAPVLSDTRTIDLNGHGTLDLTFEGGGIAIGEIH